MFFFHVQAIVRVVVFDSSERRLFILWNALQYNIFTLIFTWFSLANMWLTFSIIIELLPGQGLIFFGTEDVVSWPLLSERAELISRSRRTG